MNRVRLAATVFLAALLMTNAARPVPAAEPLFRFTPPAGPASGLALMTYNVKGLPFPAAFGRSAALARIGARLGDLSRSGRRPDVVALQEAFTPEAKAIAREAGYRYLAVGPAATDARRPRDGGDDASLARRATWMKGETEGKWVDSGLVIMSDYPIVASRRMAFPQDACAGFDCLAAKGALIVWLRIPGQAQPIAVADTHLNSRGASGVSVTRANAAYRLQLALLRSFVTANVGQDTSLIFAGDFNVGHDPDRVAAARAVMETGTGSAESTAMAAGAATDPAQPPSADLLAVLKRAKDKQYFHAGQGQRLIWKGIDVPFGLAGNAAPLSDHAGYVVHYSFK